MTRFPAYSLFRDHPATTWALSFLCLMVAARLLSGFDGLYGQDSYAYWLQARAWQDHLRGGPHPPPFFWTETYPLAGALLGFVLPVASALQFISILSNALTLYFGIRLGRGLFPGSRFTGAILFLLIGLSPWGLRSGMLVMSDSLAVAGLTAAAWWAWRYFDKGRTADLMGAGLALGLAIAVRYPVALPGLLPAGWVLWGMARRRDVRGALFPALVALPLVLQGLVHEGMEGSALGHHFLDEWSPVHWFRRDFEMQDGAFHYRHINLLSALGGLWHPGLAGLGVLALPVIAGRKAFRSDGRIGLMLGTALVCLLFVAGIPFQNQRFLLPVLPLVALAYLPVAGWAADRWGSARIRGVVWAVAALIHLALAGYAARDVWRANALDREIAAGMTGYHARTVYTFAADGLLRAHFPEMTVINLWDAPLSATRPEALLLFNEPAFRDQWQGKNPMINWDFLRSRHQLHPLHHFDQGWTLYELR